MIPPTFVMTEPVTVTIDHSLSFRDALRQYDIEISALNWFMPYNQPLTVDDLYPQPTGVVEKRVALVNFERVELDSHSSEIDWGNSIPELYNFLGDKGFRPTTLSESLTAFLCCPWNAADRFAEIGSLLIGPDQTRHFLLYNVEPVDDEVYYRLETFEPFDPTLYEPVECKHGDRWLHSSHPDFCMHKHHNPPIYNMSFLAIEKDKEGRFRSLDADWIEL